MFRPVQRVWQLLRRRPVVSLVVLGLAAAAAVAVGVNVWAYRQLRAAERALAEGRYEDARRDLEGCLAVWSRSAEAHLLAARAERLSGDYGQAEFHLHECRRLLGGPSPELQLEWLLLRAQRGELEEVEGGLLKTVDRDEPGSLLILETLARVYLRDLRLSAAAACLERWRKRQPDSALALFLQGWVLDKLERRQDAVRNFRRALEINPRLTQARLQLVDLLLEANDSAGALPHLEYLAHDQPDRPEVLIGLARCRALQGHFGEARRLLDRVLADHPGDGQALLYRGKLELEDNHPAEAERWLRRALAASPYDLKTEHLLRLALQHQGKRREAAAHLARSNHLKALWERIREILQEKMDRSPRDPNLAAEVGEAFLGVGETKLGVFWLERALKVNPRQRRAHEALARYYEQAKQPEKASEHRQALAELAKEAGSPSAATP